MKTNYIGHDEIYKTRKAEGRPGWQDADSLKETLATLEEELKAEHAPKSGKLLELGCGAGDFTLWLVAKGYDVHGVDIAPTAIDWARENAKERNLKADYRVGNVLDLGGYAADYFDLVLDGHCFHCIIGEDRKLFLSSARRVLKSGAFFHVVTMCGEVTGSEWRKRFDPRSRCMLGEDGVATRYLGLPEDILEEIRSARLQVLDWRIKARKDEDDADELLVWATK